MGSSGRETTFLYRKPPRSEHSRKAKRVRSHEKEKTFGTGSRPERARPVPCRPSFIFAREGTVTEDRNQEDAAAELGTRAVK